MLYTCEGIMNKHEPRFEVDQFVEARSFQDGYRGAWFRCKIKGGSRRKNEMGYVLQYVDFPDEKQHWTKLYQKPQIGKTKDSERELMVRPCFPPINLGSQLPEVITNVTVVVDDAWRVGNLVDWWADGVCWCGRVTKVLGDEKFKVELLPPPLGEGSTYEASGKDLRPSLDWSPEYGWTIPKPMKIGSETCHSCARLIKPVHQGSLTVLAVPAGDGGTKNFQRRATALLEKNVSFPPFSSSSLWPPDKSEQMAKQASTATTSKEIQTAEIDVDFGMIDCSIGKTSDEGRKEVQERAAALFENEGRKDGQERASPLFENNFSFSSRISSSVLPPGKSEQLAKQPLTIAASKETKTPEVSMDLGMRDCGIRKAGSDSVSSSHVGDASADAAGDTGGKDGHQHGRPLKKLRTSGSISLNSMSSGTVEAAILDLEELVNKVKWIKGILEFGMPMPTAMQPMWKFVEHRASTMSK